MFIKRSRWDDRSGTGTDHVDGSTGTCGIANQGFTFPTGP